MVARVKLYIALVFISLVSTVFIFSENSFVSSIISGYSNTNINSNSNNSNTSIPPIKNEDLLNNSSSNSNSTENNNTQPKPTNLSSFVNEHARNYIKLIVSDKGINVNSIPEINDIFLQLKPPYNDDFIEIVKLLLKLSTHEVKKNIIVIGECSYRESFELNIANKFETVNKQWVNQPYATEQDSKDDIYHGFDRCDYAPKNGETREVGVITHFKLINNENGLKLFKKHISPLQITEFDEDSGCNGRVLIKTIHTRGLYSSIHYISDALERAIHLKRMIVIDDSRFSYVSNGWEDLFLPMASCTDFRAPKANPNTKTMLNDIAHPLDEPYNSEPVLFANGDHHRFDSGPPGEGIYPIVEMKDWREYRSFTTGYITRPSYQMREYLKEMRKNLFGNYLVEGRPPRCISVHIRHGDLKTIHYYKPPSTQAFADKIKEVYNKYNGDIKHIFLMSDKQEPINELIKIQDPPYIWHYLNTSRIGDVDIALDLEFGNNKEKRLKYGLEIYGESIIASECEYFIGAFTSNVATFIAEMMYFRDPSTKDSWSSLDGTGFHSYT